MPWLQCIDQPLSIHGDWDTAYSRILMLTFERCDPKVRSTCKNNTEFVNFVKKSHLLFGYNKNILRPTNCLVKLKLSLSHFSILTGQHQTSIPHTLNPTQLRFQMLNYETIGSLVANKQRDFSILSLNQPFHFMTCKILQVVFLFR